MRSPTSPSSSCDFPTPATKRSTCTVRRMRYRHSSRLFHRKCSTSRSPSYRLHDLSRDNGRLSKLIRCPLYPQKRTSVYCVGMSALCQKRTSHTDNVDDKGRPPCDGFPLQRVAIGVSAL